MKKISLIVGLAALIVSFQNCSSPEQMVNMQMNDEGLIYDKIKTMPVEEISFWDHERGLRLDVNLNNGHMVAFEDMGVVRADTYCLSETELDQLIEILYDSEVCAPQNLLAEGEVCSQQYVDPPYASLRLSNQEINLGERVTPCNAPADLCGDKGILLRNYVLGALRGLESKLCK